MIWNSSRIHLQRKNFRSLAGYVRMQRLLRASLWPQSYHVVKARKTSMQSISHAQLTISKDIYLMKHSTFQQTLIRILTSQRKNSSLPQPQIFTSIRTLQYRWLRSMHTLVQIHRTFLLAILSERHKKSSLTRLSFKFQLKRTRFVQTTTVHTRS